MSPRNIIGPQLRKLRTQRAISQASLAALFQRRGWDVSRGTIARIEGQVRWVADFELVFMAHCLGVPVEQFLAKSGNVPLATRLVGELQYGETGPGKGKLS